MRSFSGKVAAITGAGSGIGRALAEQLAAEGTHLALCDVNESGLAETARRIAVRGVKVTTARVDVGVRGEVEAWAAAVVAEHGSVHMVFNNAGVALSGSLKELSIEEIEWLMAINFWGVVYGTKAFLPHLERAGEGHIVNVSSVFGLIAAPGNGAYNAAKFGVRGFTEALAIELLAERSPVGVSCVFPGGIATNIARDARAGAAAELPEELRDAEARDAEFRRVARTTPEETARVILQGVRRGRRRILVGRFSGLISVLSRLFPAGYQRLLALAGRRRGL